MFVKYFIVQTKSTLTASKFQYSLGSISNRSCLCVLKCWPYVCMYGHYLSQSIDQPGKGASCSWWADEQGFPCLRDRFDSPLAMLFLHTQAGSDIYGGST